MKLFLLLGFLFCVIGFSDEIPETPEAPEIPLESPKESVVEVAPVSEPVRLGLEYSGVLARSGVEYSEEASLGVGFSLGLQAEKHLNPQLRMVGTVGYERISLGRLLDGTGTILDGAPLITQTQGGLFFQGLVGLPITQSAALEKEAYRVWLDWGAEYFHPTSAEQTSSASSSYALTPTQFVFLLAGPSMVWQLKGGWELSGNARFFVNVVGPSQFELMGARLSLALSTPL